MTVNSTAQRPTTAAPPPASKMTLANVTRGGGQRPPRILLYGLEGVGKTGFGAGAPDPIFLASEEGLAPYPDVARFPQPETFGDVITAIETLTSEPHSHKTLVIDTLDWIEPKLFAHLCKRNGWADIESAGFGKGYVAALDTWRVMLARLDALRAAKDMAIILLAHSMVKTFKNPTGEDYDRYQMKINDKAAALMREWADTVMFANYETMVQRKIAKGDKGAVRGVSTGTRLLQTEWRAEWDAKNRYGLPETLPLEWSAFLDAARAGAPASPESLRAEIDALLPQLDEDARTKAQAWLDKPGNSGPRALATLLNSVRAKASLAASAEPGIDTDTAATAA